MTKTKLKLKGLKRKKKPEARKAEIKKETPENTCEKTKTKDGLFDVRERNVSILDDYITWIAMPSVMREPATQEEFAKKQKIDPATLTDWKKRSGFYHEVQRRRRTYFKDDSGDVILSLKRKCLKEGSGADVKVFLNYTEDLKDKTEIAVDDELRKALDKVSKILPD